MAIEILYALTNGLLIGLSRSVNANFGKHRGAFWASFWNHASGFAFLTLLCAYQGVSLLARAPAWLFLGGVFGALFVAINSLFIHRLGATRASMWVIVGQMMSGLLIDALAPGWRIQPGTVLGCVMILGGVYLNKMTPTRRKQHNEIRSH